MAGFWKEAADAVKPLFHPTATLIEGVTPGDWASPQQPILPVNPGGVGIRQWDFRPGLNLQFTPRGDQGVTFAQLRNFANSFDLCRLMIETRKDQVVNRPWVIRVKQLAGETNKQRAEREAKNTNVAMLTKFFQRPDGIRPFPLWIRMWLEELLVLDAPCIYPVRNLLGEPLGLRIISGSTITPLVDENGFVPQPPSPAYQQIILGLPTNNLTAGQAKDGKSFTANELIYSPRNPRAHSRWGYGPVEQIITTLQIAANWQYQVKATFTEGNIPEGLMPMPKDWTSAQIKDFQNWFDSYLAGNTAKKRRLIAVPDAGKGVQFSKNTVIVDPVVNEYLTRVVAFAFSISPQNLIKQVNRGTAKESSDTAQIEGLEPVLKHIETVLNLDVIQGFFGIDDCEFAYADEQEMDPVKQAQVDDIYIGKVRTINEVRAERGWDPHPEPEADMLGTFTPTGFVPLGQQAQQGSGEEDDDDPNSGQQAGKVKKNSEIVLNGGALTAVSSLKAVEMERICAAWLKDAGKTAAAAASAALETAQKVRKADDKDEQIALALAGIELRWEQLGKDITPLLEAAAMAGVDVGWQQVTPLQPEPFLTQAKSHAWNFANERGAELVGMKRQEDGSFIANPDARWAISDTTREDLRRTITQAFEEAWSPSQLAAVIEGAYTFSSDRAAMIAKTEIKRAQAMGNLQSWIRSGVILKVQWQLSADHACCDVCDTFAAQGEVEPGHEFAPGISAPGAHPNCECALVVKKVKETTIGKA